MQAAWGAVRSDPYWKGQYERLTQDKHPNKAIVAIERRLLVTAWYILSKREPYCHFDDEAIAYKMLLWSWQLVEPARHDLSRPQFAKYGLLRLGIDQELTRILYHNFPRRLARPYGGGTPAQTQFKATRLTRRRTLPQQHPRQLLSEPFR